MSFRILVLKARVLVVESSLSGTTEPRVVAESKSTWLKYCDPVPVRIGIPERHVDGSGSSSWKGE